MANMFQDGSDLLNWGLKAAGGVDVVYRRGNVSAHFTLWLGRTVFASNRHDQVRVEFGELDLIIEPADLATIGEPQTGDQVDLTINGVAYTFECRPIKGEPAWRYDTAYRQRYRIHMKRVA